MNIILLCLTFTVIGERSEPLSRVFNDQPRGIYIYLFYTSYSYNSISRYAYRGISAHIPRRDLLIFCVLRSH